LHVIAAVIQTRKSHLAVQTPVQAPKEQKPPEPEREAIPVAADDKGREFVEADEAYLRNLFQTHTEVQAQTLVAPYIGKWTRVSGTVREVTQGPFDEMTVSLKDRPPLYFKRERWQDRLSMLRRGDQIAAIGQIARIGDRGTSLDNCELIQVIQGSTS